MFQDCFNQASEYKYVCGVFVKKYFKKGTQVLKFILKTSIMMNIAKQIDTPSLMLPLPNMNTFSHAYHTQK